MENIKKLSLTEKLEKIEELAENADFYTFQEAVKSFEKQLGFFEKPIIRDRIINIKFDLMQKEIEQHKETRKIKIFGFTIYKW